MAFVGVEFDEGAGVALVNAKWLTPRKQESFWPPYKQQNRYNKSLFGGEEPNENDGWKLYSVKRLFFTSDDLNDARRKIKKLEETSDIQTSDCEEERTGLPKRKRKPPQRLDSFSSEDEELDVEENLQLQGSIRKQKLAKLPRPPLILEHLQDLSPLTGQDSGCSTLPVMPTASGRCIERSITNTQAGKSLHLTTTASHSTELLFTPQSTRHSSNNFVDLSDRDIKEQILNKLLKQEQSLNIILDWIKTQNSGPTDKPVRNIELPIALPIFTVDDFYKLEEHLKDKNNFQTFCIYLSSLGGKTGSPLINRILKTILTLDVASNFNFCGSRGSKIAFQDTELKKAVVGAVNHVSASLTDKEIEDCIKNWLKHAPQRLKPQNPNTRSN